MYTDVNLASLWRRFTRRQNWRLHLPAARLLSLLCYPSVSLLVHTDWFKILQLEGGYVELWIRVLEIPIIGNTGFHTCPVINIRYASNTFPVLPLPTPVTLQAFLPCLYRYKAMSTLIWGACHLARNWWNFMATTKYKALVTEQRTPNWPRS